ncbi:MAG TPA: hypothetical protein VLZ83_00855 [Edaphocola sp.]|nr:hypothetical protein [Edaphocola sp.]
MNKTEFKRKMKITENYYELFHNLDEEEIKELFLEWNNRIPAPTKLGFNKDGLEKAKSSQAFKTWCLEKKGYFLEDFLKVIE